MSFIFRKNNNSNAYLAEQAALQQQVEADAFVAKQIALQQQVEAKLIGQEVYQSIYPQIGAPRPESKDEDKEEGVAAPLVLNDGGPGDGEEPSRFNVSGLLSGVTSRAFGRVHRAMHRAETTRGALAGSLREKLGEAREGARHVMQRVGEVPGNVVEGAGNIAGEVGDVAVGIWERAGEARRSVFQSIKPAAPRAADPAVEEPAPQPLLPPALQIATEYAKQHPGIVPIPPRVEVSVHQYTRSLTLQVTDFFDQIVGNQIDPSLKNNLKDESQSACYSATRNAGNSLDSDLYTNNIDNVIIEHFVALFKVHPTLLKLVRGGAGIVQLSNANGVVFRFEHLSRLLLASDYYLRSQGR